jgi:exopolysaccharide biosynthesis polyprenyl glycosylphosphotransferase
MPIRYPKIFNLFFLCGELLLLNFSFLCAHRLINTNSNNVSAPFLMMITWLWLFSYVLAKNYKRFVIIKFTTNIKRFIKALAFHFPIVTSAIYVCGLTGISKSELVYSYGLFGAIFVTLWLTFHFSIKIKEPHAHKILIIGHEDIALRLIEFISNQFNNGYELVDYITESKIENMPFWDLSKTIIQYNPSEIFICITKFDDKLFQQISNFCESHNIKVKVVPDLILDQHASASLINFGNIPVLDITNNCILTVETEFAKRMFDVVFSATAITLGSPLFLILMALTKATSKGPALFKQERVGKNGRPFYIYKFRSMYIDAEKSGPQLATDGDPRVTKWGKYLRKTRLDELPQFWNVLKGDMSIVGPRPERQHYINQIVQRNPTYKKLQQLKPGITSVGQVFYGYAENIDQICDRVNYDLHYLKKINLNSDLKIIYHTVRVMVQGKGK